MSSRSRSPPHNRHGSEMRSISERDSYQPRAPPSRILYVREIPSEVDTKEVEDLFKKYEGFIAIRRLPHFTFVEFMTIDNARESLNSLKDYKFRGSDRPLLLDYDRDSRETRKRKEYPERAEKEGKYSRDSRERDSVSYRGYSRDYPRERDYRERYSRADMEDYRRSGPPMDSHGYGSESSLLFPRANLLPFTNFGGLHSGGSYHSKEVPCPTLFVASLPSDVTERELSVLFRFMPGFYGVRLITREGKPPICFVDFSDSGCAAVALTALQGFKFDKDSVGISIEFDKGSRSEKDREKYISDRGREKDRDGRERERDARDREFRDRDRDAREREARETRERERRGRSR